MKYLSILIIMLAACASTPDKPVAAIQPEIWENKDPPAQEVYYLPHYEMKHIAELLDFVSRHAGFMPEAFNFVFLDDWLPHGDRDGNMKYIAGVFVPEERVMAVFAWQTCIADTEVTRLILEAMGFHQHHTNSALREQYWDLKQKAYDHFCGPNYVRRKRPPLIGDFKFVPVHEAEEQTEEKQ